MTRFDPTLRISRDVTLAAAADDPDLAGMTADEICNLVVEKLTDFFNSVSLKNTMNFTADTIEVVETGQHLKDFQGTVCAKFMLENVLHLILTSGDVVALTFD